MYLVRKRFDVTSSTIVKRLTLGRLHRVVKSVDMIEGHEFGLRLSTGEATFIFYPRREPGSEYCRPKRSKERSS